MLKVNEIFGPTIQGEGKTAGKPVMFLRLSTCNLHCVWCDTPYTWNWIGTKHLHPKKHDQKTELHEMNEWEIAEKLKSLGGEKVKALVVSGGEPLLQQHGLIPLLKSLKEIGWWIEVETNGTIEPLDPFLALVDQINCSPKLSNNIQDEKYIRVRPKVLTKLASSEKVYFKFVVSSMEKDIEEITEYIKTFNLKNVYIMPLGMTKEELNETRESAQKLASFLQVGFSDRLHVTELGGGRGI